MGDGMFFQKQKGFVASLFSLRWILISLALVGLTACGFARTAVFPPEPSDVQTLKDKAAGRGYQILGVIQIDGHNFSTRGALLARLREKARELGADEVLNARVLSLPRGKGFLKYHILTAEGIAVRWDRFSRRDETDLVQEQFE